MDGVEPRTPAQLLGDRIYGARMARGWSMHRLALIAGVSTAPILGLENGRDCYLNSAARICAALGIPLDEPEGNDPR